MNKKKKNSTFPCPKCGQATNETYICPQCGEEGCVESCNPGGNNCLCYKCDEASTEEEEAQEYAEEEAYKERLKL